MEFENKLRLQTHMKKAHPNKPRYHDGHYWTDQVYYP